MTIKKILLHRVIREIELMPSSDIYIHTSVLRVDKMGGYDIDITYKTFLYTRTGYDRFTHLIRLDNRFYPLTDFPRTGSIPSSSFSAVFF